MSPEITTIEKNLNIRKKYDEVNKEWLFSVSDVLSIAVDSADPRNYWKVLKSRLKKGHNELVTSCNQLKLPGNDGKMYLTDVANLDTIRKIIKLVAHDKVDIISNALSNYKDKIELFEEEPEYELLVDMYDDGEVIHIETMLAGVSPSDLFIETTCENIKIVGKRKKIHPKNFVESIFEELIWGTFSREIKLPHDVDIDNAECSFARGFLEIKLPKIQKERARVLKIKTA